MKHLAKANGINSSLYHKRINQLGWTPERAATTPIRSHAKKYKGEYAVYRKGELAVMGSRKECAEHLGVSENYIHWMTTPTGIKRRSNRANPELAMAAVKLDD